MKWRFADFPVRTKFMVTLGIPVLGMVLLIGKQIDGSLKRLDVMEYINGRSLLIGSHANVMHEVQRESALSVGRSRWVLASSFSRRAQNKGP